MFIGCTREDMVWY